MPPEAQRLKLAEDGMMDPVFYNFYWSKEAVNQYFYQSLLDSSPFLAQKLYKTRALDVILKTPSEC